MPSSSVSSAIGFTKKALAPFQSTSASNPVIISRLTASAPAVIQVKNAATAWELRRVRIEVVI